MMKAFVELGYWLKSSDLKWTKAKKEAQQKNPWFTESFIDLSSSNIASNYLAEDKLVPWLQQYAFDDSIVSKDIGLIMAGNLPLVGFHDLLCVLACGHRAIIKLSDRDNVLLPCIVDQMSISYPKLRERILFVDRLSNYECIIATGSNHSATMFAQYFSDVPHIIRKNRNSVAVLSGGETMEDLKKLGDDIFMYFGLGCRNVSKIYVPDGYSFDKALSAWSRYKYFADHSKYRNNYDYQYASAIINDEKHVANGAIILKKSRPIATPVSVVHFECYDDVGILRSHLKECEDDIQCIVTDMDLGMNTLAFGTAQQPDLLDYADGVDSIQFLLSI